MKGVLSWLVRLAYSAGTGTRNFCSALAALVGPVQNIFFSLTISIPRSPLASKLGAGSRAGSPVF
jgi:hypothetical protein